MKKKFIRSDYMRYSKLGKKRKKLQKWRRSKGRHSKIRQKWRNYPVSPNIGYRTSRKKSGKTGKETAFVVRNSAELEKAGNGAAIILGRVGARKKIEIMKKASEMNIRILNASGGTK